MTPLISVVVCTYNRADLLYGCLQTILNQTCDPTCYEVIVVDNNSGDNTKHVVELFKEYTNLKYFLEIEQGLSHARNLGLEKSKGDYVAYLDDDVLIPAAWIETVFKLISESQNQVDGLGGPLFPFYTTPKPDWFDDKYAIQMGGKKEDFFLVEGQSFIGANMIWNKKVLENIHGFRTEFGYVGNKQTLGEETDAYFRAFKENPFARFLFSPDLCIQHWVPPLKMTLSYRLKRFYDQGLTKYHIYANNNKKNKIRYLFAKIIDLGKSIINSITKLRNYDKWQKWVYSEFANVVYIIGEICGGLGKKL